MYEASGARRTSKRTPTDRAVALTLQVAGDPGCNGRIGFHAYFYAEFSDATNTPGGPVFTPETRLVRA